MINTLGFVSIVVKDQSAALAFYTEKLGFEKRKDYAFKGLPRFLSVSPKGQAAPELVLVQAGATSIQAAGAGNGMIFLTDDCRKTYSELTERGVSFSMQPTEQPFGVQAAFSD